MNFAIDRLRLFALASLLALLTACSHEAQGIRFLNGASKPQAEPIHDLSAAEIPGVIGGKTFQYTRPDGNGFVTYGADGSFTYQDDAKGAGKGTWSVAGGQFCETFGASPMDCGEFKSTGDAYFAAKSRLVEMKN